MIFMAFYSTPLLGMTINNTTNRRIQSKSTNLRNSTSRNLQMHSKCAICSQATLKQLMSRWFFFFVKYVNVM